MTSFDSPFYPYEKVYPGYSIYRGIEDIPRKILWYLLDLPDKHGYFPQNDNTRPRVRLIKYLWHDGANPLGETLPTQSEKLSLLFDPYHPVMKTKEMLAQHPKGYRLYPQEYWGQSQTEAKTMLKVYMGRTKPVNSSRAELGICFEILSNVNFEANTKSAAYSRCYAIEQAILESLHGVNMTGIGSFNFNAMSHPDNGSRPIADEGTNVGRLLHMSLTWMDGGTREIDNC